MWILRARGSTRFAVENRSPRPQVSVIRCRVSITHSATHRLITLKAMALPRSSIRFGGQTLFPPPLSSACNSVSFACNPAWSVQARRNITTVPAINTTPTLPRITAAEKSDRKIETLTPTTKNDGVLPASLPDAIFRPRYLGWFPF